jgi:hypothetical protein
MTGSSLTKRMRRLRLLGNYRPLPPPRHKETGFRLMVWRQTGRSSYMPVFSRCQVGECNAQHSTLNPQRSTFKEMQKGPKNTWNSLFFSLQC